MASWVAPIVHAVGDILLASDWNDDSTDLNILVGPTFASLPATTGGFFFLAGLAGIAPSAPEGVKIAHITSAYTTGGLSVSYATAFPNATDTVLFVSHISSQNELTIVDPLSASGFQVLIQGAGVQIPATTATDFDYIAIGH